MVSIESFQQVERKVIHDGREVIFHLALPIDFDESKAVTCDFCDRRPGPGTTVFATVEHNKKLKNGSNKDSYTACVTIISCFDITQLKRDCSYLIRNKEPVEKKVRSFGCC